MQISDFRSLATARKTILQNASGVYTANNKNGVLVYALSDVTFTNLFLRFESVGGELATNYGGGFTLKAGMILPGVSRLFIATGYAMIIE